ncbi:MAG: hypothetical protein VKK80_04830 [Prochlorothrix sp.]|nr:hypothetical protein [Prochlorothrix sp.]
MKPTAHVGTANGRGRAPVPTLFFGTDNNRGNHGGIAPTQIGARHGEIDPLRATNRGNHGGMAAIGYGLRYG